MTLTAEQQARFDAIVNEACAALGNLVGVAIVGEPSEVAAAQRRFDDALRQADELGADVRAANALRETT